MTPNAKPEPGASKSLQTTYPFGTGFFAAIITCTLWNCESGPGLYSYAVQVGPT